MRTLIEWFQNFLFMCQKVRKHAIKSLVFLTLRAYGNDATYDEVSEGTYTDDDFTPLCLNDAKELDTFVQLAKDEYAEAENRRSVMTDKSKTLLTLGSLLFAAVGLLLPKYLAFDSVWLRVLSTVGIVFLFNAIVVLLMFFDIGVDRHPSLFQNDISLVGDDLKKSLLNTYLQCAKANDRRTDYLVDVYRASRFCFLSALFIVATLVILNLFINSPSDLNESVVRALRSDPSLINLLRGPEGTPGQNGQPGQKGDKGLKGDKGEAGAKGSDSNVDEIVSRLVSDPRLKVEIEKVTAPKLSPKTP